MLIQVWINSTVFLFETLGFDSLSQISLIKLVVNRCKWTETIYKYVLSKYYNQLVFPMLQKYLDETRLCPCAEYLFFPILNFRSYSFSESTFSVGMGRLS